MFEELNSLNYRDFVTVCHDILEHWNNGFMEASTVHSLPGYLSEMVFTFLTKYPESEYKDALIDYFRERTLLESTVASAKAGQEFLQNILTLSYSPAP